MSGVFALFIYFRKWPAIVVSIERLVLPIKKCFLPLLHSVVCICFMQMRLCQ